LLPLSFSGLCPFPASMHAEIRITVAEGLRSGVDGHAREWFAPTLLLSRDLAGIEFGGYRPDPAFTVIAMRQGADVIVITRDDASTLREFVQVTGEGLTLPVLKETAEEAVDGLSRFLRAHGMVATGVSIRIMAEGVRLLVGRPVTWWDNFRTAARKEVAGRLSVPVATFLVSLALDSDVPRAAVSAASALVGVIVWLLVSTTLEKPGYRYE
jgi:hypothetical protein